MMETNLRLSQILCLSALAIVCVPARADVLADMEARFAKDRANYERIKASYEYVDMQITGGLPGGMTFAEELFFDKESGEVYHCIKSAKKAGDFGICGPGTLDPTKFKWEQFEIDRGRKFGAKPLIRMSGGLVYSLQGDEPFSQSTKFTYYGNKTQIHRCRSTFTEYTFKYFEPNGQTVYFESPKQSKLTGECERVYPR